tara:strand:+ start:1289 stop:1429 length:141 start_codon:yes stop_codon:yes gene_type:complete
MSWHKKLTEKTLKSFGISNYAALWVVFVKGLIIGGAVVYYFSPLLP